MRRARLRTIALLLALSPAAVPAPARAESASALTLESALQTALERNPSVVKSREKIAEQEASYSFVVAQAFPVIAATGSALDRKDPLNSSGALFGGEPHNQYNFGFQLTQPIYVGGAFWAGLSLAGTNRTLAGLNHEISERDLTVKVIQSFYTILLNQRVLEALQEMQTVDTQLLKTAEAHFRIGRGQLLDVLQVKTQIALLSPRIEAARNAMKISATQLATLLGENEARELSVSGTMEPLAPARLEALTGAKKPEILEERRIERQLEAFAQQRDVSLAKYWPNVSLVGAWNRSAYVKTDLLSADSTGWSFGLQATVPIFSGFSSIHERRVLASQERQLDADRAQTLDDLSFNQIRSQKNYQLARQATESSALAYDLARQALKEAQKNYKLATIDYQHLLSSEQDLLNAQIAYAQAKYDYIVSQADYFVAWGRDLRELVKLLGAQT